MKKFRLKSNSFVNKDSGFCSKYQFVEADSLADVIEYIENNAGWFVANGFAFKVAYIEEVVE
ncbi:hypothetical protein EFL90_04870 [Lactococcus lactis]|uniref:hypothetical protein n=1 Tax=Lactococcus lactis TaxID=1358 RepID=UPI00223B884B|nr:hypothetical protein [Lactococcus lactis]MCT1194029.1 hypothetical protein [Lactococcus lactis]